MEHIQHTRAMFGLRTSMEVDGVSELPRLVLT